MMLTIIYVLSAVAISLGIGMATAFTLGEIPGLAMTLVVGGVFGICYIIFTIIKKDLYPEEKLNGN